MRQFDILNGGETMNMTRLLALVAVGILSATWARADSAHYVINLDGWDDPQSFTFIPNPIFVAKFGCMKLSVAPESTSARLSAMK